MNAAKLDMWAGKSAYAWEQFKVEAGRILRLKGFDPVFTPDVHDKDDQDPFKEWFGCPDKGYLNPGSGSEADDLIHNGHKGVNHIVIARALLADGSRPPLMFVEFGQHITPVCGNQKGAVKNRLAVYLTVVGDHADSSELSRRVYQSLELLPTLRPEIVHYTHDSCQDIAPAGLLQFENDKGEKVDAWLLTAVATFTYAPPGSVPLLPARPPAPENGRRVTPSDPPPEPYTNPVGELLDKLYLGAWAWYYKNFGRKKG